MLDGLIADGRDLIIPIVCAAIKAEPAGGCDGTIKPVARHISNILFVPLTIPACISATSCCCYGN